MHYTRDHEYVSVNGNIATVGISDHAQNQLGDIVYVELPEIGAKFDKGAAAAVVESVKAASDVYSPVSGEVVEVNSPLVDQTALINEDAEGRGWLFKLKIGKPDELADLMDETAYADYLKTVA
jgi:glycine cleavage system H protein